MKTLFTNLILVVVCLLAIGCQPADTETGFEYNWKTGIENRLSDLENKSPVSRSSGIHNMALVGDPLDFEPSPSVVEEAVAPIISDPVSTPALVIEEQPAAAPIPVASPPKTYASGPVTYGATRQSGTQKVMKTRRVAKTVYIEEPYEEIVPTYSKPVFQTVVEEYQVPVQKTRMRSETRQRTKTVMEPRTITEDYTVQVAEPYVEMQTKTRQKRVQVRTEEVAAPTRSVAPTYSAAPTYQASPPAPVPSFSPPTYSAAPPISPTYSVAPTFSSPAVATPVQCIGCQPTSQVPVASPNPKPVSSSQPTRQRRKIEPVKKLRTSRGGQGITSGA